ncbi:MAG TPA: thrombospondin type 3 repeat-containing protein [Candidatus Paceibacterota bacterium]
MKRQWGILSATALALVMIGGAYLLAGGRLAPRHADASSTDALLQAVASRDSDNDGLPDWEEALYGTDPHKADSLGLGMTDGEAVAKGLIVPKAPAAEAAPSSASSTDASLPSAPAPGTLTAAFTQTFFMLYIGAKQQNGGAALSQADLQNVVTQAFNAFSQTIGPSPDFKTARDLKVSGSGPEALKAFAASADAVFNNTSIAASGSPIDYVQDALNNNDPTDAADINNLRDIANGYRKIAIGLSVLPVPQELAGADLTLINAIKRLGEISGDFTHVNDDPLTTILALKQYSQALQNFLQAFADVHNTYTNAGVTLPKDAPGWMFVNFLSTVGPDSSKSTAP